MKRSPVVQRDPTGCGIASCAAIAGLSYSKVKMIAGRLGIFVDDPLLWSKAHHVQKILHSLRYKAGKQKRFSSWSALPDLALLAIKWHREKGIPYWHWVVFNREENGKSYVLDSKKFLRSHRRLDFGRMKPKWFIQVVHKLD